MKARIFSLLLIVALLVGVCVFAAEADTYTVAKTAEELQTMHPTCPHCGATVTWDRFDGRAGEGGGSITGTHHWYVDRLWKNNDASTTVDEGAWINTIKADAKICMYFLDIEGGSGYCNPSTASAYAFKVAAGAEFALMGKGTVSGSGSKTAGDAYGGAIGLLDGTSKDAPGGKLSIYHDVTVAQTVSSGPVVYEGGAIYVGKYGTLNMYGGTISGKKLTWLSGQASKIGQSGVYNGGAVAMAAYSTMTVEAGTITGATDSEATRGGVIAMDLGAKLVLGKTGLAENTVQILGGGKAFTNGGLIFNGGGTVEIYDGATLSGGISSAGNNATTGGGAIYNTGTVKMYGGVIKDSTCAAGYGGIINTNGTFLMEGGTISGGKAVYGGNVLHRGGTFTMTGGTIENGYSDPFADEGDTIKTDPKTDGTLTNGHTGGGNVAIINGGTFVLAQAEGKTAEIKNGKADIDGGNIFVKNGKFQLDKGTVSGGVAYYVSGNGLQGGGNIYATDSTATVDINGGVVEGGQAIRGGNVAIVSGAKFTVDGDAQLNVTTPMANVAWMGANLFMRDTDVTLTGGTFNGAASYTDTDGDLGGNIYVCNKTLTLDGATVTGGKARTGGNIYLNNDASTKLLLKSGTVTLGEVQGEGGNIYIPAKATAEISGGYVTNGKANHKDNGQGGGIQNSGILKISGGEISGNVTTHNGGNIRMNGGTLEITGGLISGGEAEVYGGNIVLQDGATATFTNGTIQNGIAWKGSNVFIHNGTFTMSQAEEATTQILGGEATHGSVYVMAGKTFTMDGGTISGGKAVEFGGNVYNAGIFDMNGGIITAGTNTEGKTVDGGNVYTSGTFTMDGGFITAGVGDYGANVEVTGGTFTMNAGTISGGAAAMEGGNVYVYAGEFIMNAGTTITGGSATTDGGNVLVFNGKFTMNDGTITAGKVEAAENGYVSGGNVSVEGGTFTMKAGAITDGAQNVTSSRGGGNVAVVKKGTFTMEGGTISGGTTKGHGFGANLYVGFDATDDGSAPTVSLLGGKIVGNKTTGGNVLVEAGTLALDGATVKDGKAVGVGGNIRVLGGTLNIKSGTVSGGATGSDGGNLAISGGTINISGGTVTGGTATTNGGNVIVAGGTVNISGGTITSGVAATNGGNIATTAGKVNMTGGTITEGSTTKEEKADGISSMTGGGNVFMNGGTFTMNGENAKVIDGTTNVSGGNVYVAKGTFTLTEGTLANGEATYALGNGLQGGGNIYATSANAKVYINGGEVYGGLAARGGNLCGVSSAELNIANDAVLTANDEFMIFTTNSGKNTNNTWGANIFIRDAVLNVTGGVVDGGSNTATNTVGRIIYVNRGTLNLSGGKFINFNRNGSGIYLEVAATTTVNMSGDAHIGQLAIVSGKQPTINIDDEFAGDVRIRVLDDSNAAGIHCTMDYGMVLPSYITAAEGYANTGSIMIGSKNNGQLYVAYGEVEGVSGLYTTKLTKAVEGFMLDGSSGKEDTKEVPKIVGIMAASEVGEGETLSFAANGVEVTVADGTLIDTNGKTANVTAPSGSTITLIDTANDDFKSTPGAVTVSEGVKVETYVIAENGNRYIAVYNEVGKSYSAHRIEAKLAQASIRPSSVGVYYTVEITCDSTLEALVTNYGVAVSLAKMPDDSFLSTTPREDILYTYISNDDGSFQSGKYHGALVEGIMKDEEGLDNAARAALPVYANAYVVIVQENGTETLVMADHDNMGKAKGDDGWNEKTAIALSLTDIMTKVNDETAFNKLTDQAKNSVQKFYNAWREKAAWPSFERIENWGKS